VAIANCTAQLYPAVKRGNRELRRSALQSGQAWRIVHNSRLPRSFLARNDKVLIFSNIQIKNFVIASEAWQPRTVQVGFTERSCMAVMHSSRLPRSFLPRNDKVLIFSNIQIKNFVIASEAWQPQTVQGSFARRSSVATANFTGRLYRAVMHGGSCMAGRAWRVVHSSRLPRSFLARNDKVLIFSNIQIKNFVIARHEAIANNARRLCRVRNCHAASAHNGKALTSRITGLKFFKFDTVFWYFWMEITRLGFENFVSLTGLSRGKII